MMPGRMTPHQTGNGTGLHKSRNTGINDELGLKLAGLGGTEFVVERTERGFDSGRCELEMDSRNQPRAMVEVL